jgi:hypothetical protein
MGGKRMMKVTTTTKLPSEVTVAKQQKKEKKYHFTAGHALAGVGTAKHVDA